MDVIFFDSLFEGDSVNGIKLCMGLTGGDFWSRVNGCSNLYRGQSIETIDLEGIVAVSGVDCQSITVPPSIEHEAGQIYYYVLRRANICGNETGGFNAVVRISFDINGELVEIGCNRVFDIFAEQIEGQKIKLVWFYSPLTQERRCNTFNIYGDGGAVVIDLQAALANFEYKGARVYCFESDTLNEGRYQFCIGAEDENGLEVFSKMVRIDVTASVPELSGEIRIEKV
jgi:hypothetical protein